MRLPAYARVTIAHPLLLGDRLPLWSEVFADYEIVQPFAQLSRETFTHSPASVAAFAAVPGREVTGTGLHTLAARNWHFGSQADLRRDFTGGVDVTLYYTPATLARGGDEPGQVVSVEIRRGDEIADLTALDPIGFSELLRDVSHLP